MSNRATCWSVTINNPSAEDEECVNLARQAGWKVEGQVEQGEEGTKHYQLMVKTPQIRFSALKKRFPRGHIEIARSPHALAAYVGKEETRVAELPDQQDKYPSLSKYWILVFQQLNDGSKDGLLDDELECGRVKFYSKENDDLWKKKPLHFLDAATRQLIRTGYHVEGIGANPNTRSQWNIYGVDLLLRSYEQLLKEKETHNHDANDNKDTLRCDSSQELQSTSGQDHSQTAYVQTCCSSSQGDSEVSG